MGAHAAELSGAEPFAGLHAPPLRDGHDDDACCEEVAFRARCADRALEYADHLAGTVGRRVLAIEFRAPMSQWGVGHVMPLALLAHSWCVRLRRACYLRLFDLQLEEMFVYHGTNESWALTPRRLADLRADWWRGGVTLVRAHGWTASPPVLPRLYARIAEQNDSAKTLHVIAEMPKGGWFDSRSYLQQLDRCLNHFVTQPRADLRKLHWPVHPMMHGRARGAPHNVTLTHAFHFRTGFADVTDAVLQDGVRLHARRETRRWALAAGCDERKWRQIGRQSLLVSDSAEWVRFFEAEYGVTVLGATAGTPTRSWDTRWESKVAAVADVLAASRARVLYVTRGSHFPGPILARSVCVQRVAGVEEACPRFNQLFVRQSGGGDAPMLQILGRITAGHDSACGRRGCSALYAELMGRRQEAWHPCFNLTARACLSSVVVALGR